MLNQLLRCAKNLVSRLSSIANQLFRYIVKPPRTSWVTGTLADLPRRLTELLADAGVLYCGNNCPPLPATARKRHA